MLITNHSDLHNSQIHQDLPLSTSTVYF